MNLICNKCGRKYFNNEQFCETCGNKLDIIPNVSESYSGYNKQKSKSTKILITIGTIVVIGVIVFLVGWLSGNIDW